MTRPRGIGVLVSGEGSNLQALIDDLRDSEVEIVGVGSSRADARGLQRAEAAGIETGVFSLAEEPDRAKRDAALAGWLEERHVELVVLAGFMELLSADFIRRFQGRIVNVHPSLLPAFPGLDAVGQALAAGAEETGVTVHFLDNGVDTGPVIAQERVAIEPGDTADTLYARIREIEHRLLPDAVRLYLAGAIRS